MTVRLMSEADWNNPTTTQLRDVPIAGRGIDDVDEEGRPLVDDNLLILSNASHVDLEFTIPTLPGGERALAGPGRHGQRRRGGESCLPGASTRLLARSMKFLRAPSRVVRSGGAEHTLGATYRLQLTPEFGFEQASERHRLPGPAGRHRRLLLADPEGRARQHARLRRRRSRADQRSARAVARSFDGLGRRSYASGSSACCSTGCRTTSGIASGQNPWWDDVLENGPSSAFAEHFDIDWAPPKHGLTDRVLLPILGSQYGDVLERGRAHARLGGRRSFSIAYYEHRLPVGPKTLVPIARVDVHARPA